MSKACIEPTCGNVWLICRVCRKLVCLHSAKKIRTDGEDNYFHAACYQTHTTLCDFCGRRHACEELAAAVARIAGLERQLHATAEGQRATLDQVIRVTSERDELAAALEKIRSAALAVVGASEAYGETESAHLWQEMADIAEAALWPAASSTSQGTAGTKEEQP